MPSPAVLSPRLRNTLDFIRNYILEHGCSPTVREIRDGTGTKSIGHIHVQIRSLARAGALTYQPGRMRSIELVPASPVLSIELPPDLHANLKEFARVSNRTPEAIVIDAVRGMVGAFLYHLCTEHKTSRAEAAPTAESARS